MTTKIYCIPKMIVQYEWILENVEEQPKTIASKMILFRGEKVFRVGLKNRANSPVLFFMAIDLNKIGMRVAEVVYGIQGRGNSPATMTKMTHENIEGEGNLQLFTNDLAAKVTGNRTFVFRICIEGILFGYSYRLSDRLAKDQLWAAAISKSPNMADVEFVVKDKKFSAHKSILAVRSPVFATEFTSEQPAGDGPFQIRIDDVDPSTVEHFLYFIYTGESWGTLANEELLKLADKYQLTTLSSLCKTALTKIKPIQMVTLVKNLNKEAEIPRSSKISPEKETEIFFDRTTATFRCNWTISENQKIKTVMQYQNEDMFLAYFTGKIEYRINNYWFVIQPIFHCFCAKHRSFGLKVEDVYFTGDKKEEWSKMETENVQKSAELSHFISKPESKEYPMPFIMYLYIKIISTIDNYNYEMMDDAWMKDFWFAATTQKWTDVEIFVGSVKLMEAHRVILSARSPVLNTSLVSNTGKAILTTFDAKFDVEIVRHFVKFLYTGFLELSANNKQLLELATIYEVETLKNICQLANRAPPDAEELTDALFEL